MVEIFDGVLQFLEDVFLALAVARDVGDGPVPRSAGFLPRRRAGAPASAASAPALGSPGRREPLPEAAGPSRAALDRRNTASAASGLATEHALDRLRILRAGSRPVRRADRRRWNKRHGPARRSRRCRRRRCRQASVQPDRRPCCRRAAARRRRERTSANRPIMAKSARRARM